MTSVESGEIDNRPPTPVEEDCCGNGCNPCIFDIHKKLLEKWNKEKFDKLNDTLLDKNYLSPVKYSAFIIDKITKACEDCIFVCLNCKSKKEDDIIFLSPSQHVMIKLDTVTKPYTPISWSRKSIKLLIKLYSNGKASNYVKKLKVHDELSIRGPYGEFKYQRNSYKHILMLSIGSGIAAMYPLASSIVQDDLEDTKINMTVGFRSFSHVPLNDELRLLSDYWNFECTLYLSQESTANMTGINIVSNRLNGDIIRGILNSYSSESCLILICGTTEFNETVEKIVVEKEFSHYHVFR
ncbi:NADH-cytochrome b5 reductase-like [Copidosoma floridanum]|uniref:NADH-cytochrome b5 reductase-like n=1 Tax=Copidosoma floridanum TaxID=29053 RepID=UPI000C6F8A35|nr:NADH-cytochrome b5 reductase-like [Copidosoma floridanum]